MVVVVVVVADVVAVLVMVVVAAVVTGATGVAAAAGVGVVAGTGAAALVVGVTTGTLVSVGFIANRSSSGAASALPSDGAKGSCKKERAEYIHRISREGNWEKAHILWIKTTRKVQCNTRTHTLLIPSVSWWINPAFCLSLKRDTLLY